jgi:hypothetical protein
MAAISITFFQPHQKKKHAHTGNWGIITLSPFSPQHCAVHVLKSIPYSCKNNTKKIALCDGWREYGQDKTLV